MSENIQSAVRLPSANSYARLPTQFYARMQPTPVARPRLIKLNRRLAVTLGLDPDYLSNPEGVEVLAGSRVPEGAEPVAMAYAGHQFGHFVPQLGDGRALLLGEVVDRDGVGRDIHLKGLQASVGVQWDWEPRAPDYGLALRLVTAGRFADRVS